MAVSILVDEDIQRVVVTGLRENAGSMLIASHSPDLGNIVRPVDRLLNVHHPEDIVGEVIWIENWA